MVKLETDYVRTTKIWSNVTVSDASYMVSYLTSPWDDYKIRNKKKCNDDEPVPLIRAVSGQKLRVVLSFSKLFLIKHNKDLTHICLIQWSSLMNTYTSCQKTSFDFLQMGVEPPKKNPSSWYFSTLNVYPNWYLISHLFIWSDLHHILGFWSVNVEFHLLTRVTQGFEYFLCIIKAIGSERNIVCKSQVFKALSIYTYPWLPLLNVLNANFNIVVNNMSEISTPCRTHLFIGNFFPCFPAVLHMLWHFHRHAVLAQKIAG